MKFENVTFSYDDNLIFDNFSLELPERAYSLTGDSGKGKTTFLKLASGLLVPSQGIISGMPEKPSLMFQEDRLIEILNVRRNLEIVCSDRDKIEKLLEYFELDGNLRISELSGGMARRVAFIRAFIFESDALFLDEPFNGMDEGLVNRCIELIRNDDRFIIICSHQTEYLGRLDYPVIRI